MKKFVLLLALIASPVLADDTWKFAVTPYLWLPTINGQLNYQLPPQFGDRIDVETGPHDYLTNLKFALMLSGEARRSRYSVATDLILLDFGNTDSTVRTVDRIPVDASINKNTTSSVKGALWTLIGGYTILEDPKYPMDAFAGVQYVGLKTHADWELTSTVAGSLPRTGSIGKNTALWDGIVGLRGSARVGERWTVPYYADIGTGSSQLTWQLMSGIAYSYQWGDVGVVYRHIAVDQKQPGTLKNISFSGPALKFTFRF